MWYTQLQLQILVMLIPGNWLGISFIHFWFISGEFSSFCMHVCEKSLLLNDICKQRGHGEMHIYSQTCSFLTGPCRESFASGKNSQTLPQQMLEPVGSPSLHFLLKVQLFCSLRSISEVLTPTEEVKGRVRVVMYILGGVKS